MSNNTTPPKSLRSRMGTAMRRTSSILALSRPSTPGTPAQGTGGRARSSSITTTNSETSSASRPSVDTSAPTIPPISTPSAIMMPSPIAESPAREAAATADEIREELREPKAGPTPLTQVLTASTEPGTPVETVEPSKSEARGATILGSADEPHILTEEPEEMSLRAHTIESNKDSAPNEPQDALPPPPPLAESPAVLETAPSYFEIPAHPSSATLSDSSSLHKAIIENTMGVSTTEELNPDGMLSDQTTPRPHGPADTENANVFYAFSEAPAATQVGAEAKSTSSVADPTTNPDSVPSVQRNAEIVQMPMPEIAGEEPAQPPPVARPASDPIPIPPRRKDADAEQIPVSISTDDVLAQPIAFVPKANNAENLKKIVAYDVGSTEEIWASQSDAQNNRDAVGRQLADNSTQTLQDPFADPVPSIHPSTIGTTGPSVMPEPEISQTQNPTSILAPQTMPDVVVIPVPQHEDVSTRARVMNDDFFSDNVRRETE
ncbi:hypothetical protein J3R30DRAFT_21936 [Lentinula aciculospora]|uniref:Uncharacterized protein n=1 Tax=Lentinula aciculospora TaxID=153920 RepID=A0A9W9ATM0_9AGAR|nr:hypothetical protein J3R30DRAFT_21936 [Lentinula aciculospora]